MINCLTYIKNYHIIFVIVRFYIGGGNTMPSIKQSVETEVWDEQGNMVSKRANKTLSWGSEPPFVKLYLQDVLYLSDVPKSHESIIFELIKRATYAGDKYGMTVTLSAGISTSSANSAKVAWRPNFSSRRERAFCKRARVSPA